MADAGLGQTPSAASAPARRATDTGAGSTGRCLLPPRLIASAGRCLLPPRLIASAAPTAPQGG